METEFIVFHEPKSELKSAPENAIYFEVLHGKEAGNRIRISLDNGLHRSEVIEKLEALSEEDVVTAELEDTLGGFVVKSVEKL